MKSAPATLDLNSHQSSEALGFPSPISQHVLAGGPTYCYFGGAVGHFGHQAVSELDSRVFGGDGQTFLQNFHQADPELKHSLWVFFVEPQVVDLFSHCSNPQDALEPVTDL